MWKKVIGVLVSILVGSLALGQVFPRNETLYISGAAWGPPIDWNPFITWSKANTSGVAGLIYEPLFFYDPVEDKLIPWLAESSQWVSDQLFVVKLREGLTWQDGTPLTSEDVKFTFELGRMYPALWFSYMWQTYLGAVNAPDPLTVEFVFTATPHYQSFENVLYNLYIVPASIWATRTEDEVTSGMNPYPIGSGAYRYFFHGPDRNVYIRNDDWWGTKILGLRPAPKYIIELRFTTNALALGSILKGEIDLSNNFLPGVAELVRFGYIKTYLPQPPYMLAANTAVLFLNTTKKPMDDPAFRRALAFAIDVDSIVKVAFGGLVDKANPTGLLPHLWKYVDEQVVAQLGFTYDPAQAKEILAAAGYKDIDGDGFVEAPDGAKVKLEITCPFGWTDWMEAIRIIAESARAVGINVEHRTPDYGAWSTALVSGTFDMTLNNWAGLSNTPWTLYNLLFSHPIRDIMGGGNFGRYDNPTIFDLVDRLAQTPTWDVAGMKALCSQIQQIMLAELPMIPLWYNGLWAQYQETVWTNFPGAEEGRPKWLPCTWAGYWQMGGLHMLCELKPAP